MDFIPQITSKTYTLLIRDTVFFFLSFVLRGLLLCAEYTRDYLRLYIINSRYGLFFMVGSKYMVHVVILRIAATIRLLFSCCYA